MKKHQTNKILLIDPDKLLTDELAGRLGNVGFDILSANDSDTAFKLLQITKPTLILLDILMKGKDGEDILTTLKSMSISSDTPIIVLTSDTDVNSKVYGFLQGASDYIQKPVIFEEVLARINNQIRLLNTRNELEEKNKELKKKNMILEQMAITDPLTSLFNKGYIADRLKSEMHRAARYDEPISLILMDIDNFKESNDIYGHLFGDKVLKKVSKLISASVRDVDIEGRYGGDEFLIICPNTDIKGAKTLAERIRKNVNNHKFKMDDFSIDISVSLGVSSISPSLGTNLDSDVVRFIGEADIALYRAKANGRNKVVVYETRPQTDTAQSQHIAGRIVLENSKTLDEYSH